MATVLEKKMMCNYKKNGAALADARFFQLLHLLENPGSDDPLDQVELTPEAKISLTLLPNIKMTPVD